MHRRAPLLLALLVLFTSCFPGARAPSVTPTRTLSLGEDPGALAPQGTFGVVFAAPRGETEDPSEVTLVFNRPMRPLELAGAEGQPPARLVAKGGTRLEGAWRWMGTSALIFAPKTALPRATEYTIEVPAGTKSLAGEVLEKPFSVSFATPRPRLVRVSPGEGSTQLLPDEPFELRFNQPVDPREIERAVHLRVGDAKTAVNKPFHASWPDPRTKTYVKLVPAAPLPKDTDVTLVFDASLRGLEGERPLGAETRRTFRTVGPLKVGALDCFRETPRGACSARDAVRVHLSNPVAFQEWKRHVRLEPAAKIAWGGGEDDDTALEDRGIWANLRPATSYRLVLTAGMKDEHGQVLAKDAVLPFDTDDEWPQVEVGLTGSIFEAQRPRAREVPIGSVNESSYTVLTAALDEFEVARVLARKEPRGGDLEALRRLAGAKVETVEPRAPKNTQAVHKVDLDALLAAHHGRGAAVFSVRATERRNEAHEETHVVSVTDLSITAKMSRFGSLVWVTRLSDGKPVPGATVRVLGGEGDVITQAKTDADGVAKIEKERFLPVRPDGQPDAAAVVTARLGDDWAFREVSDMLGTWRFGASVDTAGRLTSTGMLITDRGVYRPGEEIRVKGIFRKPLARGTETPRGREVRFFAFDAEQEKILDTSVTLGDFGDFALTVPVPKTTRLGNVELRAELAEPAPHGAASASGVDAVHPGVASAMVLLAAYKPAEFKVAVEPDRPSYIRGDKASFTTRGDYLFGAPMSGGALRFTVTRGPTSFAPPGAEDLLVDDDAYQLDLPDADERAAELASGRAALGPRGDVTTPASLALPHQKGTELVTFESEVTDVSRQAISGDASAIVHPGEFYVALAPPKELFVPRASVLAPEVAAIEPSGKRRVGVSVTLALVRRTWQTVIEARGESGEHYDSKPVDTVVSTCAATTTTTRVSCKLTPKDPGYYLVRATATDPRGNPVAASYAEYVLADGEGGGGFWMGDAQKLDLVLDKKSYEVGDTATILVKNPFPGAEAWVTVERAGVYREERHTLAGAMPTLKIQVTEDMRPNAFVGVHLVHGRAEEPKREGRKAKADVGAPSYRLGYAEIRVSPESRRLKVALTPAKRDLRPGENVEADIVVTDRGGKPTKSNLLVYAVDEGVLMLTGYKTPDPIPVFSAPRALAVFSLESRDDLAKIFLASMLGSGADKGLDGGGGGSVRQDFRATAYFEPSLLAAEGRAHVSFKLPDSLTTYRLMAVAVGEDDRFGFGESQITASRKLMARPALPRFLRAGDAIDAGVVLSSKGMAASTVEVTAKVQGLDLGAEAKKVVALPANGSVEVHWPITAPRAGKAVLTFTARSGGETDAVEVTREVLVPMALEAVALAGDTTASTGERLGDLRAMRDDVGGLEVHLASTALVGLGDGAKQLLEYPYGCTEQLASRLVPLVALGDLGREYGIALPPDASVVADDAVSKILKNQIADGSFGYWNDSPRGDAWVTTYAFWALGQARAHGHRVPEEPLLRAKEATRRYLAGDRALATNLAVRAFALDALAQAGDPDPGAMSRLYERRAELPLFARALLAHAMITGKMGAKEVPELLRDVDNHLRVTPTGATVTDNVGDAYAALLDSDARTTALVLRALVAHDPGGALAPRIAKGLLGMRHGGTWRSTQETAWSLVALADYARASEARAPAFDARVFFGDALLGEASFHEKSARASTERFSASKLFASGASGGTLAFEVQGTGRLFYEARLSYARREMPRDTLDRGFFVRRVVRSVAPEALAAALGTVPEASATSARAGDLVLVDLFVVTATPRESVVVVDPLPAGLEAVDANLATTARSLDVTSAYGAGDQVDEASDTDDARASGRAESFAYYHREVKDDEVRTFVEHMPAGLYHYRYLARATTPGKFLVPPTRAECMYEPETFGRTAGATFEVAR